LEIFDKRHAAGENTRSAKMKSGTMGLSGGNVPHRRDVIDILLEVWNNVTPTSVRNCWR
jgi:hypothetical protein